MPRPPESQPGQKQSGSRNSPAMCCASAALPPLPASSTLPPARMLSTHAATAPPRWSEEPRIGKHIRHYPLGFRKLTGNVGIHQVLHACVPCFVKWQLLICPSNLLNASRNVHPSVRAHEEHHESSSARAGYLTRGMRALALAGRLKLDLLNVCGLVPTDLAVLFLASPSQAHRVDDSIEVALENAFLHYQRLLLEAVASRPVWWQTGKIPAHFDRRIIFLQTQRDTPV